MIRAVPVHVEERRLLNLQSQVTQYGGMNEEEYLSS